MAKSNNSEATVLVGEKNTKFCLQSETAETLCAASPFFKAALKGGFREAAEQEVRLPDYNDEAFTIIVSWLSNRDPLRFKDLEWTLLCEMFVLADYLRISPLEEQLLKSLRWKRHKSGTVLVSSVPFVYDKTYRSSPLRRLWVDWVLELQAPEIFESEEWIFPMEFMRELAAAQMRDRKRITEKLRTANQKIGTSSTVAMEPKWVKALARPSRRGGQPFG